MWKVCWETGMITRMTTSHLMEAQWSARTPAQKSSTTNLRKLVSLLSFSLKYISLFVCELWFCCETYTGITTSGTRGDSPRILIGMCRGRVRWGGGGGGSVLIDSSVLFNFWQKKKNPFRSSIPRRIPSVGQPQTVFPPVCRLQEFSFTVSSGAVYFSFMHLFRTADRR